MLENVGDNLYIIPDQVVDIQDQILLNFNDYNASGLKQIFLRQGFLEQSNVELSSEMADLINAQRAYQLSSRAINSSDQMMTLTNNLRGQINKVRNDNDRIGSRS